LPDTGDGLGQTVLVWNGTISRLPRLVVAPATIEELVAAVAFARDHGLLVRVRSPEEHWRPPLAERSVTLDLSRLADLRRGSGRRLS
jgi:FAD/FMN-containing dehydrogenase